VIFLGEFSHCGYKMFFKKLGKLVSIVWIPEKNAQKLEKNGQVYKLQNWEKKENTGSEVHMCALQINYGKTCCETKGDFR
jgi:hypothetical protein